MDISRRGAFGLIGAAAVAMKGSQQHFSQFLRLAFLRSPNYAAGSAGWTINQDGSAEFNNLTVRGEFDGTDYVVNKNGEFWYSPSKGAGNLIASIAAQAGTDSYGNSYDAGVTSYTSSQIANLLNAELALGSQTVHALALISSLSGDLSLQSPLIDASDSVASMTLESKIETGLGYPQILADSLLHAAASLTVDGVATIAAAAAIPAIEPGTASTPESWHSMTPYLASGVSAASGWQAPSYRLNALGDIDIQAALSFTSGGTGNDNLATLPSGYHGSDGLIFIPCAIITFPGSSGVHAGYATLASNGNLNVHGITASGTAEVVLGTGGTLSLG